MNDDPDTNVHFVQVIETYPCLYDHSRADYSNRDTQDKAWIDISKQFDASVSQCKERWKNLRACYTRHLKAKPASGSATKFKKPYYLAEDLNFLEPFTKSRKQSGNMSILLPPTNFEKEFTADLSEPENEEEENDQTNQSDDSTPSSIEPSPKICTSTPRTPIIKKKRIGLEDVNKAAHDFFLQRKKTAPIEEDLDLCFLKSVLPDMKCMTPDQKRRFKVGVINLSGSILNEKNISFCDQNQITSGYSTQYHNLEKSSNLVSPPMSSSSGSTYSTHSLNLAHPSTSSQVYTQEWSYNK